MPWSAKQFARRGVSSDPGIRHGFRSGLEEKNADLIRALGHPVLFETFKIPYVVPATKRTYTPDFLLPNGIIIETKGIFDATDRAKHLIIHELWPELDIRFVFSRCATRIAPGSKTTLADWADKYGYRYAEKLIPEGWFRERGPKVDPREVLSLKHKERIVL